MRWVREVLRAGQLVRSLPVAGRTDASVYGLREAYRNRNVRQGDARECFAPARTWDIAGHLRLRAAHARPEAAEKAAGLPADTV